MRAAPKRNSESLPTRPAQSGVAAVERALSIINAFGPGDASLSLHDLATRTDMYKSTVLRLIATLESAHCIQRLDDGRYQLGSMLLHWGGLYQATLRLDDHVLPVLRELVRQTGEGASFFTRERDVRVCLFRVDSPHSLRDHVRTGDLLPLDRGAAGRVLLDFDPAQVREQDFPASAVIATVGEREPGIAAVAAPVFGPGPTLRGALAVSGPSARLTRSVIDEITGTLVAAAMELTRRLGGNSAPLAARSHVGRRRAPSRRSTG